jgi:hypothetical protein
MAEQANLNKNGYVDFDDYMAEQAPKKKINKKKKNNKKPIINNSSNYTIVPSRSSRTLDRIEGLDVFGTLEKRDNVNDLNVLTVLRNLGKVYPDSKVLACLAQYGNVTSTDDGFSSPDGPDIKGYMNLKPGVPDKMCMLYWRGSHFFTVILDIQRKHITYCESFASSNESVIRALLSEVHGGYFETARPRKGLFSFSDIDSSDYTFSIVHNAQSGAECGWWALLSVFLTMQGKEVNTESYSQRNIDILQSM